MRRCKVDYTSNGGFSTGYVEGFDPSLQQLEVASGTTTRFDLDLKEASCELRGHVRSSVVTAHPWNVRLTPKTGFQGGEVVGALEDGGTFRLSPVVLGPHVLVLAEPGSEDRDQRIEETLEIRRGSNEWSLDLPVGALEGDAPPGTVLTHVWKNARGTTCTTHFLVDVHGKFHVEGIPAGSGSLGRSEEGVAVEVRPGETTHVAIR